MSRFTSQARQHRRRLCPLILLACVIAQAPAQSSTPESPVLTLHVSTQLVLVDASVEHKKTGEPIEGLTPADFTLTEDGVPQVITSLSEAQLPLSVVLLFDLTDTVHPVLVHLSNGAAAVLRHLRPQDEVAVMTFSSQGKVVQAFTHDRMSAVEGIDSASASYDRSEPTFLAEDLWQASQQTAQSRLPDARRVQIWLSDGSANDQERDRPLARHAPAVLHTEAEAVAALLHSDAVVSALIERGQMPLTTGRFGDLERYAALTGGPVLYATASDAAQRLSSLLDTLRERYTLGYRPSTPRAPGTVCSLQLTLSPAFFAAHPGVRAREITLRSRHSYVRSAP
ncbi:MAG: VWA domain-containing protein [Janthinobacterium lividum]